ncbi:type II toxin-antitoxin system HipA family toxin [Sulfurimonas sp.]|uniref:type II toxin-antitoxin system HipA family toxin n=1 Tax=Sulfurimonas sp. TaxID=2022749 RepID=UPI0026048B77|nr:type II toxin-antitoxin system HipA family toxin [Sulfurimonas sp.]MCW8895362.1 type II toxin-antitoxin system HipA family toxin [Sulfurimonas sp.]MCW9067505.1 type II toxin-antitoxin system HipA family toxin [Sulfurimonas sp.]
MNDIKVLINNDKIGTLFFDKKKREYGFNYVKKSAPISLTMPYKQSTYSWQHYLHPIFEMNLPEGYLFEIFKKYLSKEYGYIDDFLVFSYLAPNIESRLTFESDFDKRLFKGVDIDEILNNDSEDTFMKLLKTFLDKNAISGVQPKTLALIKDKESLSLKEYIVKTWGEEYPYLAENEYFCMKAVKYAGVSVPNIRLSINKKFLLVEKFNYNKKSAEYLGFEEVLVLLGKNRDKKYSGSYEQIAKTVYTVSTDKETSMSQLYKTIVMSYLLKNGDAHLKNFGVLYDSEFKSINFAPAYDIVNTTAYIFKDKPALTMFGKKIWFGKKELIKFGINHCYLSLSNATVFYEECNNALKKIIEEIEAYKSNNKTFDDIACKIIDSWRLSLNEKSYKEIPDEIIRNWTEN